MCSRFVSVYLSGYYGFVVLCASHFLLYNKGML